MVMVVKESSYDFIVEYLTDFVKEKNLTVYDLKKIRKRDNSLKQFIYIFFYKRCNKTLRKLKENKDKYKFFYIDINVRAAGFKDYLEKLLMNKDFKVIAIIIKINNNLII